MLSLVLPDADQVRAWLEQAGIKHYICDQCHGLHISEVQSREGVLDSRLFVEEDSLLLTTELELRPAAIFSAVAEMPRFNMSWPALKVFADVNDETLPRLVACDLLHGRQGVTFEQFVYFVQATVDASIQLLEECQRLNCLFWPDEEEADAKSQPLDALH